MRIVSNADAVAKATKEYGETIVRYALPTALTATAYDAKAAVVKEMASVFDRPTKYTLNSVRVSGATKTKPYADVWFRDFAGKGNPASKYLRPEIEGGARRPTGYERALQRSGAMPSGMVSVPGNELDRDSFGNVNRGRIVKILSYFRSFSEVGYSANRRADGKGRGVRKNEKYFIGRPGGGRLPLGVYQVAGRMLLPVLMFVRAAQYAKRLPYDDVVERTARAEFPKQFAAALTRIEMKFNAKG